MAVFGVFLSLFLCLCCLRFEKSIRGSKSGESLFPSVLLLEAGSCCGLCFSGHVWFFSGVIPHATWRCIFGEDLCISPHSLEDIQGDGGRWESRVDHHTVPGAAGEPLDCFPSVRQQSCCLFTLRLCMVSAQALVSRTLWPTRGSLHYRSLCSRAGLGTPECSQALLQGYLAGQVPADVNFQMPWHGRVASEAPLPKAAALCSQFPHVWPSSLYHLTGSE